MAQTKTLNVPITGGIRQDLSEHVAPNGTLVEATNVRFSTSGEVESRPGTDALSAATDADVTLADIWDGTAFIDRAPGGFAVGSSGFGFRYDGRLHISGSYANAEPIGVIDTMAREQIQPVGTLTPSPLSQAATNGYVATVYSCGNQQDFFGPGDGATVVHVMTENGTMVASALFAASKAWLVKDGSNSTDMILVTQDTTTGLFARRIVTSATGATIGAAVSVGTLNNSANFWAACTMPTHGWALLYQSAAAVMNISFRAGTGAALASTTFAISAASSPCSVYADVTNVYVGWRDAGATYDSVVRIYNAVAPIALVVGNTVLASEVLPYAGPPLLGPSLANNTSAVTWIVSRAPNFKIDAGSFITFGQLTNAGVSTLLDTIFQCTAISAPFGPGYLWVRGGGFNAQQQTNFERIMLLDFMSLRTDAASSTWLPVLALTKDLFVGGPLSNFGVTFYKQFLSSPVLLSDNTFVQGIPRIVRAENSDATNLGLALAEWLHFRIGGIRQTARFGTGLIVTGFPTLTDSDNGTRQYDTASGPFSLQNLGTDLGSPLPASISVATSNGSGDLTSSGTYSWRVVIERIDNFGRRWRSAPSDVDTRTLGAADDLATVTCNVGTGWLRGPALNFGNSSQFVLHVYRTTAGGATFYRASPAQGASFTTLTGAVTYIDALSDTRLAEREILYTDGGVLANDCPPSCRFARATEDRIWLAGLWEAEQLQSSKILVPGEPPQFSDSPAFRAVLPEACTGVAYQDGTLVAFTRSAIYAIQGTGPNDQGQGAWDSPRCITRSSGCVNALSIVETSAGIFYQSIRGIELLPRGLGEPAFVGMAIQDTLGSLPVQSASVVSTGKDRTVRFTYGSGAFGSNGTNNVLVYDLDTQCWSRDVYPFTISGICDTDDGAVLATNDPDLDSGYAFLIESDSLATDQSNTVAWEIASTLTWARTRPFGVAGMGRYTSAIGLFDTESPGYRSGNATITLSIDSQTEPGFTFNMNTLSGASYRRVVPRVDEGSAAKLTLTTAVAGWRFMGWTVELDELVGGRRMGETEQG